jgi:CRP-like cAMP-binding protein
MIAKEILAGLELFEGLPDDAQGAISAFSKELAFAAKTTIFSPEQSSKQIFLLLRGSVRLTIFASSLSEPVTIAVLKTPGQAFGFSSIIGQGYYNSSAEALTDVRVISVEGRSLMDYLEKEPAVGYIVMKRLAHVISRRLGVVRRVLLETIIDYERQTSSTDEN